MEATWGALTHTHTRKGSFFAFVVKFSKHNYTSEAIWKSDVRPKNKTNIKIFCALTPPWFSCVSPLSSLGWKLEGVSQLIMWCVLHMKPLQGTVNIIHFIRQSCVTLRPPGTRCTISSAGETVTGLRKIQNWKWNHFYHVGILAWVHKQIAPTVQSTKPVMLTVLWWNLLYCTCF